MTTGMEYFCTGVGFPYLHKATLFSIISPSSTSANYTKCNKDTAQHQHKQFTSTRLQCSHCMWPQTYIFSRILTSNHNSRSIWSRRLASRSSPMNMATSRPLAEWRHFVEVNSRNLGGSHVCWGSYDGFNVAGWCGGCVWDQTTLCRHFFAHVHGVSASQPTRTKVN